MEWLAYTNMDELSKAFMGLLVVGFILFLMFANIYWWIKYKVKKK